MPMYYWSMLAALCVVFLTIFNPVASKGEASIGFRSGYLFINTEA